MGAKITRGITNSTFGKLDFLTLCADHVAMILRFDSDDEEIYFFDSTANGVQITKWSIFRLFHMDSYNQYGYMAFKCYSIFVRHLECERTEPFLAALENFVKTTLGNAYAISLKNVLFRRRHSMNRKSS